MNTVDKTKIKNCFTFFTIQKQFSVTFIIQKQFSVLVLADKFPLATFHALVSDDLLLVEGLYSQTPLVSDDLLLVEGLYSQTPLVSDDLLLVEGLYSQTQLQQLSIVSSSKPHEIHLLSIQDLNEQKLETGMSSISTTCGSYMTESSTTLGDSYEVVWKLNYYIERFM